MNNLRIVTQQENCFNRITSKGYYFYKKTNKWRSYIKINYKSIHLGSFDTEQEAIDSHKKAKEKYHIINHLQ